MAWENYSHTLPSVMVNPKLLSPNSEFRNFQNVGIPKGERSIGKIERCKWVEYQSLRNYSGIVATYILVSSFPDYRIQGNEQAHIT